MEEGSVGDENVYEKIAVEWNGSSWDIDNVFWTIA